METDRNEEDGQHAGVDPATRALAAMLPGAVAEEVLKVLDGTRLRTSRSEDQGELVKALCAARPKFGVVERSRTAKVTPREGRGAPYTYDYATLSDSIAATTDALAEQGIAVFQDFEQGPGEITIFTELVHSSNQWRRSKLSMPVSRDAGPQGLGSAITYGRRYARNAILDLAPTDDDDGQAAQRGAGREEAAKDGGFNVEALQALAKTDPTAAFAAVRKAVASAMGCGDISEARLGRLMGLAERDRGWTRDQVNAACQRLLGTAAARVPWKAYELVVELFCVVGPQVLQSSPQGPSPTGPQSSSRAPSHPDDAPQREPAPRAESTEPAPSWEEVWAKIRQAYEDLAPEALADPIDSKTLPAVLEGFARAGWSPAQVEDVLLGELRIGTVDLPKDGTHPSVFRMIAKALRLFKPADVRPLVAERYEISASEESSDVPTLATLEASFSSPLPATAHEAWSRLRAALVLITKHYPEAVVPISPDERLVMYGPGRNGNRSSGDVSAIVAHHLGVLLERTPAILFPHIMHLLSSFPVRTQGREAVLSRLPAEPEKLRLKELADLCHELIRDGHLAEDEVARSGAAGKVSKEDLVAAIGLVRERALSEAVHA